MYFFEVIWNAITEFIEATRWGIAGGIGAGVASRYHKDELDTRIDFVVFITSGALTAQYLTGLISGYFDISLNSAGGIGFLIGAFGGSIIQTAIHGIRSGKFLEAIKNRFLGR